MKQPSNEPSNSRKLSFSRSLLLVLAFIPMITLIIYISMPSETTQSIFLGSLVVTVLAVVIFGISRIGRKVW